MSGLPKAIVLALGPWYTRLLRGFVGVFLAGVLVAGMFGAYQGCHDVSYGFQAKIVAREARTNVHAKLDKILKYVIAGCAGAGNCAEAIEAAVDCLDGN